MFVHLIADYGTGDPAFGEVVQKLALLEPSIRVHHTSVPAFSTLATGFWVAQYALVNPVQGMVVYANTAPRRDNQKPRKENEGEGLTYALLQNGVKVVAVNSGFTFSFVRDVLREFHLVRVSNKGSQFRSRDFHPEAVVGIGRGEASWLGERLDPETIPPVPQGRIAWIDGYGNIKTTMRRSSCAWAAGQQVTIALGCVKRTAFFTDWAFRVREGEFAFAPGSSGGEDRFMELFLRGESAWAALGKPNIEDEFTIQVAS